MTTYRTKLVFALVTLIIIVLIGLGLLIGQIFKSHYIQTYDSRLNKEVHLVSSFLMETEDIHSINEDALYDVSKALETRITLVDTGGKILYDSGGSNEIHNQRHPHIIQEILQKGSNEDRMNAFEVGGGSALHYYFSPILYDGQTEGYLFFSTRMTEIQKAYQQIWWLLIFSLGTALIIILILGARITSRYTRPIEAATKVAIELAKGNYHARTYEDRLDEPGKLSSSLNVLARNLQSMVKAKEIQQERLAALIENMGSGLLFINGKGQINLVNRSLKDTFKLQDEGYLNQFYYEVIEYEEICDLIEEIFMTEHKVKKQLVLSIGIERRFFEVYGVPILGTNEEWKGILVVFHDITELKKLEQVRKDFVANVSHELKTPITSIKGFTETLLDGAMDDRDSLEKFLHIILQESDRLQSLILDLLELSKIEKQGYTLHTRRLNVIQLVEELLPIFSKKTEEKNLELSLLCSGHDFNIEGDYDRLKQVFINLISNAIAYTLDGGKVTISLKDEKNLVRVSVIDTGIGINQDEISRIFERFYRVDKARSRNSGGTGLGLAIVKHLVEAHKGQISVESKVGQGTTFTLLLYKTIPKD